MSTYLLHLRWDGREENILVYAFSTVEALEKAGKYIECHSPPPKHIELVGPVRD